MKTINTYINEKLVIGNNLDKGYNYYPKNKYELMDCIKEKAHKEGLGTKDKPLDLNDIDTSKIIDMSQLFNVRRYQTGDIMKKLASYGDFDISDWDVSNVRDMEAMFYCSGFNGDISEWNVGKVEKMGWMFARSFFNNTIANWDISNVKDMTYMFADSQFARNIDKWNVSKVITAKGIFSGCKIIHPKWYYSLVQHN